MLSFTEIKKENLPRRNSYTKRQADLMVFMNMNVECVKVTFDKHEYINAKSAQNTLTMSVKRAGLPIKVSQRKGEVYLIRTDM